MMKQKRILVMINRFIAMCYLSIAFLVGMRVASGEVAATGGIVLIVFLIWQAFGHFRLKGWAPKVTAALSMVVNLLAIPYLFAVYEPRLLPPFQQRLVNFLLITFLTFLLVMNYYFFEKLKSKTVRQDGFPRSQDF